MSLCVFWIKTVNVIILEKKVWDKKKSEASVESGHPADNMKE